MINAQQKFPGISTDSQPAATTVGDKYFLAWTKSDGTIWWTTLERFPAGLNRPAFPTH